jgi:hypothetical protein
LPPPEPRGAFSTISSVRPEDPQSWDGRTFLTFDIDWAHDAVIEEAANMVEAAGVPATWFVTHDTPVLARLRANPVFELGIHPNFLPLLMQGNPANGATAEEVVDRLLAIVPEARSVRSHSLIQSGRLLELFRDKGLTHEANAFIPETSAMALRPWVDWFGMIKVPYFWEDDFWCDAGAGGDLRALQARPGIRGYDFHPIHVFLNTETLSRYEGARNSFRDPEGLRQHRNAESPGVADMLRGLLASDPVNTGR